MHQQSTFDFPQQASYNIEEFIVTSVNSLSFQKICQWPESWSHAAYPYFLLLIGPKQSGKTHLAHIWAQKSGARFLSKVSSISSSVIVEDIDEKGEKDLLSIFNMCNEAKKYCLFTSSKFPDHFKLKDLVSRLKSIDISHINTPDKETIKIVLSKEFASKSLQVEPKMVSLIADLIPLNFYSAYKAVNILNRESLSSNKPINASLIKKLFLATAP